MERNASMNMDAWNWDGAKVVQQLEQLPQAMQILMRKKSQATKTPNQDQRASLLYTNTEVAEQAQLRASRRATAKRQSNKTPPSQAKRAMIAVD